MPYTTFSDGSVLTASQVNTNFRDQVISQVTSGTRPSGVEGQMIYETDTDRLYVYSGSGWVEWAGIGGWASYTPTLTQSAAVTKTTTWATYMKLGRTVFLNGRLDVTGAGTANNVVTVSLPFTAARSSGTIGSGDLYDASAGTHNPGITYLASTTTLQFLDSTQPLVNLVLGQTGSAFAAAFASGDIVFFSAVYESTT